MVDLLSLRAAHLNLVLFASFIPPSPVNVLLKVNKKPCVIFLHNSNKSCSQKKQILELSMLLPIDHFCSFSVCLLQNRRIYFWTSIWILSFKVLNVGLNWSTEILRKNWSVCLGCHVVISLEAPHWYALVIRHFLLIFSSLIELFWMKTFLQTNYRWPLRSSK